MLKNLKALLGLAAAGIVLAACSQANSGPPAVTSVNNGSTSYSKLQFAVGTANVDGIEMLNVVSTLRQPDGLSADLVDSPSITMPFSLGSQTVATSAGGPDGYSTAFVGNIAPDEASGSKLTSTGQTVHPGAPLCMYAGASGCNTGEQPNATTFGQSGGVFGMGLQPANNTINGSAFSYVPYSQPIFPDATTAANMASIGGQFVPWGGPPAFDDSSNGMGTRDGLHNLGAGLLGWNQGITIFDFSPAPGTFAGSYTLSVVVPTGPSTNVTISQSASITSNTPLATISVPSFTEDANGGLNFTGVTLPAGATEGYLEVTDFGGGNGCQGVLGTSVAPVYYTIAVKSGTTSYSLPDTIGPNTTQGGPTTLTPSASICPGDSYSVQYFAMDYPLYEASYPKNTQQAPTLVGGAGQDDITISAPTALAAY